MRTNVVLIVFAAAAVLTACNEMIVPSSNFVTEVREVSDFTRLSVERGVDVDYTVGSELSVKVIAPDNVMRYVEVYNMGKELRVRIANDVWFTGGSSAKVHITAPDIAEVELSDGSDMKIVGGLERDNFKADLSGGSELEGYLKVESAIFVLSGGSSCDLVGAATKLTLEASGGSSFDADGFVTDNTRVALSGGSEADLTVNKVLDGAASGGSSIEYRGTPEVNVSLSGGSRCRPLN